MKNEQNMNWYEPMLGNVWGLTSLTPQALSRKSGQIKQKRLKLPRCRRQTFDAHLLPSFGADDACTGCLATGGVDFILYDELTSFWDH